MYCDHALTDHASGSGSTHQCFSARAARFGALVRREVGVEIALSLVLVLVAEFVGLHVLADFVGARARAVLGRERGALPQALRAALLAVLAPLVPLGVPRLAAHLCACDETSVVLGVLTVALALVAPCLLYTSPSPRDRG